MTTLLQTQPRLYPALATTRVFLCEGSGVEDTELHKQVEALKQRCQELVDDQVQNAAVILGLGQTQPNLKLDPGKGQRVLWWFHQVVTAEVYNNIIDRCGDVQFYHGEQGLQHLVSTLEEWGLLATDASLDPLAQDAFVQMQGEYLSALTIEVQQLQQHQSKGNGQQSESKQRDSVQQLLQRVSGSAGTYEFDSISQCAKSALARTLDPPLALENLLQALADSQQLYQRSAQAYIPSAVEEHTRQRVLVLVRQSKLKQQLNFALNNRRMQIDFHDTATTFMEAVLGSQPDLIVIEQQLNHFDGLDLVSPLRSDQRFAAIPVLALLPDTSEHTLGRCIRSGVDSWLEIPFSATNVALSVINLLNRMLLARKLGGRDPLTGIYTKEAMVDRLQNELIRATRSGKQIALLLVRLSEFTDASPRQAFVQLAEIAGQQFRQTDVLARYNEATLAVVLPGVDIQTIVTVIHRFLQAMTAHPVAIAASLNSGSAPAQAIVADAELRLGQVLAGETEQAIGLFQPEANATRERSAPRILIADTDEAIVQLLRFFCTREGYQVEDVANGLDTLAYLEQAAEQNDLPDVLILETFLPGADGFQILEKVQQDYGNQLAVIMLSVRPSEERVTKAFQLGASDFVAKPFRVPEMIARIRNGLIRTGAV